MNIDVLIPDFSDLGAQRVAINIANSLSSLYEVNFVVLEDSGPFKGYLKKDIRIVNLSLTSINIPKIRVVTKAFGYSNHVKKTGTNIAISFSPITNFFILYAKHKNKSLKTIIQEHAFPSVALKDRGNASFFYEKLFKNILVKYYNKSDIFLTIANAIQDDFVNNFSLRNNFFEIVRNPLDLKKILSMSIEKVTDFKFYENRIYLIGIGRLAPQKNFKMLIKILFKLRKENTNIELILLGEGDSKDELKLLSKELGLDNYIHFLGFQNNPYKYLARADIFCLTSIWEGLPQVLAESMVCKTLVISHMCQSGPEEMIDHEKTGILVTYNNIDEFTNSVFTYSKPQRRCHIESKAFQYALSEYSNDKAKNDYIKIIEGLENE